MHINQQSAIHAILVVRSLRPSAKRYGRSSDFIARKMTDGRPLFLALILYIIKELHDAYTDNSGKRSPVYDSTALTEICEES